MSHRRRARAGATGPLHGLRVAHHLLVGHSRAIQAFRASDATGDIGIIHGIADIQPASDDPGDVAAARRTDKHFNGLSLDPIMKGRYPEDIVKWWGEAFPEVQDGDVELISTPIDSSASTTTASRWWPTTPMAVAQAAALRRSGRRGHSARASPSC